MNKRGEASTYTPEQIIKIVLSIMGIFFLIMLSVQLTGIFKANSAERQARATLDELEELTTALSKGETTHQFINLPQGWAMFSEDKKNICIGHVAKKDLKHKWEALDNEDYLNSLVCSNKFGDVTFYMGSLIERKFLKPSQSGFSNIEMRFNSLYIGKTENGIILVSLGKLKEMEKTPEQFMKQTISFDEFTKDHPIEDKQPSSEIKDYKISKITLTQNGKEILENEKVKIADNLINVKVEHGCDKLKIFLFKDRLVGKKLIQPILDKFGIKGLEKGNYFVSAKCFEYLGHLDFEKDSKEFKFELVN